MEPTATTPTEPAAATAPAGWHPDPHDPTRSRYWDGSKWSDYVSRDNLSVELMEGATHPSPVASVTQRIAVLAITLAALSLLVLYGTWKGGADDDPSPSFAAPEPRSEPEPSSSGTSDFMPTPPDRAETAANHPPENVFDGLYFPTIAIRYRSEDNNGVVTEVFTAFDPPRSIRRNSDGTTVLNDGEFITNCNNNYCRRFPRTLQSPHLILAQGAWIHDPADLERRQIAGLEADCSHNINGGVHCWSVDHEITLLQDPGDEAMQPGVFTTRRLTAVEVRPPTATDFALPDGAEIVDQ